MRRDAYVAVFFQINYHTPFHDHKVSDDSVLPPHTFARPPCYYYCLQEFKIYGAGIQRVIVHTTRSNEETGHTDTNSTAV